MFAPNNENAPHGKKNVQELQLNRAFQNKGQVELGFDKAKEAKEALRDGAFRLEEQAKFKDEKKLEVPQLRQLEEADKRAPLQNQEMRGGAGGMALRRQAGLEVDGKK